MEKIIIARIHLDNIKKLIDTLLAQLRYAIRCQVSATYLDDKVELRANENPLIEIDIHKNETYGGYILDIYLMRNLPKKTRTLITNTIHIITHRILHNQC